MKVLVACEESQEVCKAFRARGHEAYSCDIQECSGGHPEWHIQDDVLRLINGYKHGYGCPFFVTNDGETHDTPERWDMIIAHPPCTRLCSSGQRWLYYGDEEYREKKRKDQEEAIKFFLAFTDADCDRIAIENPVGIMSKLYRKPDCIYNPYDFTGETECKKTCLWLKNLPPLMPTEILADYVPYLPSNTGGAKRGQKHSRGIAKNAKESSKTFKGIAKAMAEQWGSKL